MSKLIFAVVALIFLYAAVKHLLGFDDEPQPTTWFQVCSKISDNRAGGQCFAEHCLFDEPEANAPSCQLK